MSGPTSLAWFRRDHRLHDNTAFVAACDADRMVLVYCVNPREYGDRPFGGPGSFDFEKTGTHRARLRPESPANLRTSLRDRGGNLVVRESRPESVLPEVAAAIDTDSVTVHMHPTPKESHVESAIETELRDGDAELRRPWRHTLTHLDGPPMALSDLPGAYTTFRKAIELVTEDTGTGDAATDDEYASDGDPGGRGPLPEPIVPPSPDDTPDAGDLPTVSNPVGTADASADHAPDDRGVLPFDGGEMATLDHVESYIWTNDRLREYKEVRNGLLGTDYSSKFSPWLNEDCLSPRYVKVEVGRYKDRQVENDSMYWLVFELR